jgi:8-oxo-dGTP diphosphatase
MTDTDKLVSKRRIRVVAAEIVREGRFLITQRQPFAVMPLLWEFPGGRVQAGEEDADALARELAENLGISCTVRALSMHVTHEYEGYLLDLLVYRVHTDDTPAAVAVHAVKWVLPAELSQHEFPGADQQTVDALLGEAQAKLAWAPIVA